MYNNQRSIKKIEAPISIGELFSLYIYKENTVFLDSSLVNDLGEYSIIGLDPYLFVKKEQDCLWINDTPTTEITFEEYIKDYLKTHKDLNSTKLPILSGAIGYFSYDYGRKKNKVPSNCEGLLDIPDAIFTFYDVFIIENCRTRELYIVSNGILKDSKKRIREIEVQISDYLNKKVIKKCSDITKKSSYIKNITANFEKEDYKKAVAHMIDYIVEGDIYIANMTQQLIVESSKLPEEVFYDLRKDNPSPFGGYLNYEDFQIVCASPERFLKMKKGHIETRPIKGTRKRGETPLEDLKMKKELQNSEKDKSELLMIVDLERNDLNKVCKAGSVKVTELFTVEEYATVFHLVSNIEGELEEGKDVIDLIDATFPGGSITGAPKYRAMEIIDELEHSKRNLYTGSIGYFTLDGDCDFNIVIRTAIHKNGTYYLGVGGGITSESELEFEYEETLQKAKAVLKALGKKE